MVTKYCIPHLMNAENPHILMLSPPPDMKAKWFEHLGLHAVQQVLILI